MRARAFARTRPDISSPLIYGGMEMGGCAIGRACVRMRMRERRERGRGTEGDGGRGRFSLLQGISQGAALPLSQVSFICCKEYPPGCSLVCVCARPITHPHFPPPIYGGGNGHIGACARARVRVRMRMRMREGGCLSCCVLYTPTPAPSPSPLPHRCGKV